MQLDQTSSIVLLAVLEQSDFQDSSSKGNDFRLEVRRNLACPAA